MSLEELIEQVKNGTCPFTGKPYDCARCEIKPKAHEEFHGSRKLHCGLCITHPLSYRMGGWDVPLEYFDPSDRREAMPQLARLLQFGVEQIPFGDCDFDHYCFKHGCVGHPQESEVAK